jgi:Ca2+/Na+ antiporter
VVATIGQHRSPLVGNILGSSISNILGAFSLGLILSPVDVVFDRSSKIYTGLLLALTSTFVVFLVLFRSFGRIGGGILVAAFVIYVISIGYCIYKGMVSPPEDDDDDDDSDTALATVSDTFVTDSDSPIR